MQRPEKIYQERRIWSHLIVTNRLMVTPDGPES